MEATKLGGVAIVPNVNSVVACKSEFARPLAQAIHEHFLGKNACTEPACVIRFETVADSDALSYVSNCNGFYKPCPEKVLQKT